MNPNKNENTNQEIKDVLAIALSAILGSQVVKKSDYDAINLENKKLLDEISDIDKLRPLITKQYCQLIGYRKYHSQWKPTTRNFEARLKKLKKLKLYVDFNEYPEEISANLQEAYNCYLNGVMIAGYIMILRTIEIAIGKIYDKSNEEKFDKDNKKIFVPAIKKLNWAKSNKLIGGHDYRIAKSFIETRNDTVHEIYKPTDLQILSSLEAVIKLLIDNKNKLIH